MNHFKTCAIILFAAAIQLDALSQTPGNYIGQPTKKTYTKLQNLLIKKNVPVEVLVINGQAVLEGDILLGTVQDLDAFQNRVQIQSVVADENLASSRWQDNIIPFEIHEGFTDGEVAIIISAMNHFSERTNVCFIRRTLQGGGYIKFVKYTKEELGYSGGQSHLGRCGYCPDGQEIKLSAVTHGVVRHEIGHALGLLHEQAREDRNMNVKILEENIKAGFERQFGQSIYSSDDVGSYDFNSIMHYQFNAFGKLVKGNALQTIRRLSNTADRSFGNTNVLSQGDINAINSMYPEDRTCTPLTVMMSGELNVGESKTLSVYANKEYNYTGVYMRDGQKFSFTTASPAWNNGSRETDCDGYTPGPTDGLRRYGNNMFAMIGEIFRQNNKDNFTGKSVKIGCGRTWTATASGYFMVFANDMFGGYGDNSRIVTLTIRRTE